MKKSEESRNKKRFGLFTKLLQYFCGLGVISVVAYANFVRGGIFKSFRETPSLGYISAILFLLWIVFIVIDVIKMK